VKDIKGLNGATVCVAQGTTHEVTLAITAAPRDRLETSGVRSRRHHVPDVFRRPLRRHDPGRLCARRRGRNRGAERGRLRHPADDDQQEPLGPFTRNGDEVWSDIITWLHYGLVEAEELGVTATNADEMTKSSTPAIQRLLGASGDLARGSGSTTNGWCRRSRPAAIMPRF